VIILNILKESENFKQKNWLLNAISKREKVSNLNFI
jgi:hypothetical protein